MINFLAKYSNSKVILSTFLLTLVSAYLFFSGMEEMSTIAGEKMEMIDARKSYTLEEAQDFFVKLKAEGRAVHRRLTSVNDMLFPLIFGAFSISLLAFFIKSIFGHKSKYLYLALYPMIGMVVDYMENFNTLAILDSFPELTNAMVEKGSRLTALKHQLGFFRMSAIALLGAIWILNKVAYKNTLVTPDD